MTTDAERALTESTRAGRWQSIVPPLLLGLAAALWALLTRYHWQSICDDAFIYFRFARNLGSGHGPVWNPGDPVEGFSSPLWLGLLAVGQALGRDLRMWSGVLGILCSAATLFFVYGFTRAASGSRLLAAMATALTALVQPLYFWAPAGLETALFSAIITASAWSLLPRGAPGGATPSASSSSPRAWAVAAAILGVARPEGPFMALSLVLLRSVAEPQAKLRLRLLWIALGPAVAWQVFRLAYYHAWFPNTYYAKSTGAFLWRIEAGVLYALPGLFFLAVITAAVRLSGAARRQLGCIVGFAALLVGCVLVAGGDWMWHKRMLVPMVPALIVVGTTALATVAVPRRLVLILLAVLAGSPFLVSGSTLADAVALRTLPPTENQEGTMTLRARDVAAFIEQHYPPDALVAVNHAGALPYALPNPAVDMTGLVDRHIARKVTGGLHEKHDPNYVLDRRPRVIVLNSETRPGTDGVWYHPGYWSGETALFESDEFQSLYRAVNTYWEWRWREDGVRYVVLYELRGTSGAGAR